MRWVGVREGERPLLGVLRNLTPVEYAIKTKIPKLGRVRVKRVRSGAYVIRALQVHLMANNAPVHTYTHIRPVRIVVRTYSDAV